MHNIANIDVTDICSAGIRSSVFMRSIHQRLAEKYPAMAEVFREESLNADSIEQQLQIARRFVDIGNMRQEHLVGPLVSRATMETVIALPFSLKVQAIRQSNQTLLVERNTPGLNSDRAIVEDNQGFRYERNIRMEMEAHETEWFIFKMI